MATLHDILHGLPPEMQLKNSVNGKSATVAEMLKNEPDLDGLEVHESKSNYGRSISTTIYYPGVGRLWYEPNPRPIKQKGGE